MNRSTADPDSGSGASSGEATGDEPRRRRASAELRARLIEAGLAEFSARGFDGASTRAIAARAGAHQPQINYHFDSKEALWRACVAQLMAELDAELAAIDTSSPRAAMAGAIRALVHVAARRPELNRIMIQEGTAEGERLRWIVDEHLRPRHAALVALWQDVVDAGDAAVPVDPALIHHLLIGAATLLHANAPEARLLGIEPGDPALIEAHADALVRLLLRDPAP